MSKRKLIDKGSRMKEEHHKVLTALDNDARENKKQGT